MDKEHRANELADQLQGTCKCLADFATEAEQNDIELMELLDDRVFECESCGWWCEISEASEKDDSTCIDCE